MAERFNFSRQHVEEKLKDLFKLSMNGDQEAYASFLTLASALVKKYLTYLGGKYEARETIEDLLQEILLSIHQKKHTFQLDKPLLPWLYAVARYRFIDHYRAKKRLPRMEEISDELPAVVEEDFFASLEEILEMLTPKQRDMVMLVKVQGATYAEAAGTLNMSVPSLKVGIHRVIKAIKEKVAK
jgi:RNA polymerase sigma-70 factor (ECF subfamily)